MTRRICWPAVLAFVVFLPAGVLAADAVSPTDRTPKRIVIEPRSPLCEVANGCSEQVPIPARPCLLAKRCSPKGRVMPLATRAAAKLDS